MESNQLTLTSSYLETISRAESRSGGLHNRIAYREGGKKKKVRLNRWKRHGLVFKVMLNKCISVIVVKTCSELASLTVLDVVLVPFKK